MMKQFLIVSSGKEKNMLNKSDIKYIIKKVIIILIVALIFYFIRNIPVSAQTNDNFISTPVEKSYIFSDTAPNNSYENLGSFEIGSDSYNFYNNYTNQYTKYIYLKNKNDNTYYLWFMVIPNIFTNVSKINFTSSDTLVELYDSSSNLIATKSSGQYAIMFSLNDNLSSYYNNYFDYDSQFKKYTYDLNTDIYSIIPNKSSVSSYLSYNNFILSLDDPNSDWSLISTNISEITVESTEIQPDETIPSNYSEIDLQGYQGVVVVPKDYTQLSIESVNNVDFYQFPFYYVGCQNYGYFSLQNSQMIVSDLSNINVCSATPTLVEALFPVYYNEYNSVSGIGTQQYQSNAIVIYNRNYDYSSFNPYSSTKVYIDLSLYNYELVSDFSSYSSSFTYIDKNGNEFTQTIDNIFSFEQLLQNGVNQDTINNNLDTKQKIDVILNYLKLPVNFLNSTIHATCQPLRAQFPHSDKYIELPCISNVVQDHLPEGFLSFIRMVVNGFVMYRVVMSTSIYLMNQMNPHDLGIEVIDL